MGVMAWEELLETRKEAQIAACKFKLLSSITSMSALRKCQSNLLGAKERFKEVVSSKVAQMRRFMPLCTKCIGLGKHASAVQPDPPFLLLSLSYPLGHEDL